MKKLLIIAVIAMSIVGCGYPTPYGQNMAGNAAIGGLVGASLGAGLGAAFGGGPGAAKGAAVGGVLGVLSGAAITPPPGYGPPAAGYVWERRIQTRLAWNPYQGWVNQPYEVWVQVPASPPCYY